MAAGNRSLRAADRGMYFYVKLIGLKPKVVRSMVHKAENSTLVRSQHCDE